MPQGNLNEREPKANTTEPQLSDGTLFEILIITIGCIVIMGIFGIENLIKTFFPNKRKCRKLREPESDTSFNSLSNRNSVSSNSTPFQLASVNCCLSTPSKNLTHDLWSTIYTDSNGNNQSPVNINTTLATVIEAKENQGLSFNRQYFLQPHGMTMINDGYGLMLGTCFEHKFPIVHGGPLRHKYRFNLVQFKWGPTDDEGSEHTIDLKRYAMEMQLMHMKGKMAYKTLEGAVNDKAVAYLSFFFEVTPTDNPYLAPLVERLTFVRKPNSVHQLAPFPLCWLFHPFKSEFYYYHGSLSNPPYTEGVKWIVQLKPLSISRRQLNEFRKIQTHNGPMLWNSRPVQNLNERVIQFYT